MLVRGGRVEHGSDQPGLADARLADQEYCLALASHGLPPALKYKRQLLIASHHGWQPARLMVGLEAALGGPFALHQEAGHRVLEALEPHRSELAQIEHL